MRRQLRERPGLDRIEVYSAGTIATDGNGPLTQTVIAMREDHGIDLSPHRARRLNPSLEADLLLAMDRQVIDEARKIGTKGEVRLIGDFAGSPGEEVADPYGGSLDDHRECARQIARLVGQIAERLERETATTD